MINTTVLFSNPPPLFRNAWQATIIELFWATQTYIMIYYSAASSSLKKKTDLKGILSHGLCFSVERRVIFPLRNVKCKDYISCQFVETTHLRLICIRRMKSRSSSTRKRPKEKRLLSFLQMFSNVQHLKGLMIFSDN